MINENSQVVFITGASSGLGKAVAEFLVTKGYKVYGTSRSAKNTIVNGVHFLKLDVTDPESIKNAVGEILVNEQRIDFLINNAGKGISGPLEEIPEVELKKLFETNYFGPLNVIKAILPTMRSQNAGMIINVTSIAGFMGLPYRSAYSASKGALGLTTEALRMELKEFNIKLANVAPGDFATNIAAGRYAVNLKDSSPYFTSYLKSLDLMNAHVDKGESPDVVARAVYTIMRQENPKVNYKVGAFMQRFSVFLKGILPSRVYERLLLNHYKL